MNSVLIVIPAYKNPEQLQKCLSAIESQVTNGSFEKAVHVVDNNKVNIGFTLAINEGLRLGIKQSFDYVVALNQDCYLANDALLNMIAFMEANRKCAIGAPKQISSDDPDFIICGGCKEAYPFGRHITGNISNGDCKENKRMPWVNGACMIFRVSALIDTGVMDENMFLIGSDSDICYRARYAGYEVWYIADAQCVHEHGVSSQQGDEKVERIKYLDMLAWRNKWYGTDLFRELVMEIFE